MKSKRFSIGKVFFVLLLSSKAKILFSVLGVLIGTLISYDPYKEEFSFSEAIAWSMPFVLLGLFIGFLVDSSLNRNDSARNTRDDNFQPEPMDGSGNVD